MDFQDKHHIHFFGIGGIGVSAIARYFIGENKKVSGSDRSASEITEALVKEGAKITIGEQNISEIPKETDLIIYSAAITVAEPKLLADIKKLKIPSLSYSEVLGEISRGKYTIAVAGTHGKTTTTGMVATTLIDGGLSPAVIVGSILNREKSNFVSGAEMSRTVLPVGLGGQSLTELFVVEADEYRRSFLSLSPKILVINNIDLDHLDYFKDLADIQSAYREIALRVSKDGFIVTNPSSANIIPVLEGVGATVVDYTKENIDGLALPLPGVHNLENAKVALAIGNIFNISRDKVVSSLNNFLGTWRRFEKVGETSTGAVVYDDYAHNPQKISALIEGAREKFPDKKITIIFQPHLYSRTKTLFDGFVSALAKADRVIVAPIFPAREVFDPSISSEMLVSKIREKNPNTQYLNSFDAIISELKTSALKNDVIITVGAGDVYKIGKQIIEL